MQLPLTSRKPQSTALVHILSISPKTLTKSPKLTFLVTICSLPISTINGNVLKNEGDLITLLPKVFNSLPLLQSKILTVGKQRTSGQGPIQLPKPNLHIFPFSPLSFRQTEHYIMLR